MKNKRPSDQTIASSPVHALHKIAVLHAKAWSDLKLKVLNCFVSSFEAGQPLLDPFAVKALLSASQHLRATLSQEEQRAFDEASSWAEAECRTHAAQFEARMTALCRKQNITLQGKFPSYILAGFLDVEARPQAYECHITGQRFASLLVDTLAPVIVAQIQQEQARSTDAPAFLAQLHQAYTRAAALRQPGTPDLVAIRDVFKELLFVRQEPAFFKSPAKGKFKEYSVEFFSRDLAKLLSTATTLTPNGYRLNLGPTSLPAEGIPVRCDGAVRIVGRVGFTKEN